ncbi:MAG TPA: hypothetical protein VGN13_09405 [Solirubrobacteraceae bacterium]|jgi:DNA-directed RNA polymerase specialized sigma24 family protein
MGNTRIDATGTDAAGSGPAPLRAPWRRGPWSPAEVAAALRARRAELGRVLRARADARALSDQVVEEILDDAIAVVAMMRRPVVSEEHLVGAFWATARLLVRQHREGRHAIRVGSRTRRDFDEIAASLVAREPEVADVLLLRDRAACAADYIAELSELEQRVMVALAVDGLGIKAAARSLGVPLAAVKAAQRSGRGKLDRIAAISTAGRMCGYRQPVIDAYARGSAGPEAERVARAHLAACASCRAEHAKVLRQMRARRFQRDAALTLLPSSLLQGDRPVGMLTRALNRVFALPRVGGGRAAELLGGAGVVKIAAAGGAVVVATATLAGVRPDGSKPHRHHAARTTPQVAHGAHATSRALDVAPPSVRASGAVTSRASRGAGLTPQQHAEMEFALPSTGGRPQARTGRATTAAVPSRPADVEPSPQPAQPPAPPPASSAQAAREFGQP